MSRFAWFMIFGLLMLASSAAIVGYGGYLEQGAVVGRVTFAAALVLAGIVVIAGVVARRGRSA